MERYEEILEYWFGEDFDEDTQVTRDSILVQEWFRPTKDMDQEIKGYFEKDLKAAQKGKLDDWEDDPESRLALLVLLDQFSRNIYRGDAKAFDNDLRALELSLKSIKDGFDGRVSFVQRQFYYMPLMHAENLEVQQTSVQVFTKLILEAERYEDPSLDYLRSVLDFAKQHLDVFQTFGRFPWRNDALNRRSTTEERLFLSDPDNSSLVKL